METHLRPIWRCVLVVLLALGFGEAAPFAVAQEPNVVHPLPEQGPPWLDGYQVRWPVRICGDWGKLPAKSVLVTVPTGGWLKPDASDIEVQSAAGKVLRSVVLSSDPTGDTIVQFERNGADPWYWVYGANPKAPPRPAAKLDPVFHEGLTMEIRDWAGDDLSSWTKVRAGLDKSTTVLGNAVVGEVVQSGNPARPGRPQKFAASYRGYLDIKKPGIHRFFVNADDASFLFVDGFKVFERPGSNGRVGTVKLKDLDKMCGYIELTAGVHSFEVHQAVGDKAGVEGVCALLWSPPDEKKFNYVLSKELKHPLYARAAGTERLDQQPTCSFVFGIDDTLEANGVKLFLVRFEAHGNVPDDKLVWDMGDGSTRVGRSIRHVYFREADYLVTLQGSAGLPPFRRTVHTWPEPGEMSPLSLELAVKLIEEQPWKKLPDVSQRELFAFLVQCAQPNRWKLLDEVSTHLLARTDLSLDFRSELLAARVDALAHLGRSVEGVKLAEKALPDFAKTPLLQVRLQLAIASVWQDQLKDFKAASKIYKAIVEEHGRTEHPFVRRAGIRWGDLFAESGDLVRAAETYRLAASLGGERFQSSALTDASTRGAMLRIAEQKLRTGDFVQTRQLLEQLELNYPGQRIDGFYCYLRAETDRQAGRYESALRHYETIFRLPQWAGYRDRALFGIAQCHFRRHLYAKARAELKALKEQFPKSYDSLKAGELSDLLDARIERVKTAQAEGDAKSAFFNRFDTGFEPEETLSFGGAGGMTMVAAPGIQGPHVALVDPYPLETNTYLYNRPGLKNLEPGGTYWVEVWYKDEFRPMPPGAPATKSFLHTYLVAENPKVPVPDTITGINITRSTSQWHKLGFKLKVPLAQDYLLRIYLYQQTGVILYDGLSVRPVSDAQVDALARFIEGAKQP